jgi:hypothetical protein
VSSSALDGFLSVALRQCAVDVVRSIDERCSDSEARFKTASLALVNAKSRLESRHGSEERVAHVRKLFCSPFEHCRSLELLAPEVKVPARVHELRRALGPPLDERTTQRQMELPFRIFRNLVGQKIPERRLGNPIAFSGNRNHFLFHQLADRSQHFFLVFLPGENVEIEIAASQAQEIRDAARGRTQPRDDAREQFSETGRQVCQRDVPRNAPGSALVCDRPAANQVASYCHASERTAECHVMDETCQADHVGPITEQRPDESGRLFRTEWLERDQAARSPKHRRSRWSSNLACRIDRGYDRDRTLRCCVGQHGEERTRGFIDALHVVDGYEQRVAPADGREPFEQRLLYSSARLAGVIGQCIGRQPFRRSAAQFRNQVPEDAAVSPRSRHRVIAKGAQEAQRERAHDTV